jgi:signal transduction histidine kinase
VTPAPPRGGPSSGSTTWPVRISRPCTAGIQHIVRSRPIHPSSNRLHTVAPPPLLDERARDILGVADLLSELDVEVIVEQALAAGRRLTGARYAAVGVLDESRDGLERFITAGIEDDIGMKIGALPRGHGVLGELIRNPAPLRLTDVGDHPRSYGFPVGHPPMNSFLGVPILVDKVSFGSLYLTEKGDGVPFTDADEAAVVSLARLTGVAIGHARTYTTAAAQRDELARTVSALEATTEIARAIGGETDLGVILKLVAKRGRALVAARSLIIELVDNNELVVAAAAGDAPTGLIGQRMAMADTVASTALRTGVTQLLEGALNRARFDQHGLGQLGVSARAGLVVPLVFHGRRHGVLLALDHVDQTRTFTAEDQRLLEAFATSAATAVATARAAASELHRQRVSAAEDERRRWARELHDETLQSLGGLMVLLSGAQRRGGVKVLQQAVANATEHLGEAIVNLRALVIDLRPPALDELGLEAALDALTKRVCGTGLEIDSSIDLAYEQGREATRPTPELETALYRISQEALTNATKHGRAERAVLELSEQMGTIRLIVRDDGSGFDQSSATDGFGLLGMRERVELLGGKITIASTPGVGTTITTAFPAQRVPATPALDPPATPERTATP